MKCPSCSKTVPDKKFCVFCGTRLSIHCPRCEKVVEVPLSGVCPSCNTDFAAYEKAMSILAEAESLEKRYRYEDALYKYESIPRPVSLKEDIVKQTEKVRNKIEFVAEKRALGEKAIKRGSVRTAKKAFLEVQKIIPTDEQARKTLKELAPIIRRKTVSAWGLAIIILVIAGIASWEGYKNTLSYCVKKDLVKLLDSQSLDIRTSAALVLAMRKESEGVAILKILSNSNDERKRLYSLTALLPFSEVKARNGLRELLYNGSVPARIGAGWALINDGDTSSVVKLRLGINLSGTDEDLRIASAVLMFNLGYSEGLPEIEKNLEPNSPDNTSSVTKFKTLYAMYLLGDKDVFASHIGEWAGKVTKLLKDKSDDVKLIAAFLLNKTAPNLAKEDSVLIESILWNGFLRSKDRVTPKLKEMPEVQSFYLAKDVINNEGDEELSQFLSSAREIRQACQLELSKIELGDKSAIEIAKSRMDSPTPMEQLYGAIVGYKIDKIKSVGVLKKLLSSPDDNLKLLACKTVYEFILQ